MESNDLLLFAIGLSAYFVVHSILANQKVKDYLMANFISKRYYRLAYNFFSIVSLLPIAWYYMQVSSNLLFEIKWLGYLGLITSGAGLLLLFVALRQYDLSEFSGTQQFNSNRTPDPVSLKTTGFNGIVRHPLYFASLLIIWGWWFFKPTDLFLVTALVSTIYLYIGTRLEEQKLIIEFGGAYSKYQAEVWMLVPFLKRKKRSA